MSLQKMRDLFSHEIIQIEKSIEEFLATFKDVPVKELSQFVLSQKHKRLRPLFTLMSFASFIERDMPLRKHQSYDTVIRACVSIELIHLASLLHDDIVDQSEYRYGHFTVQNQWNTQTAMLWGNILYVHSFDLATTLVDVNLIHSIVLSTRQMCYGELLQVYKRDNFDISFDYYLSVITKKTADLFGCSAFVGACCAEASEKNINLACEFGKNIGIAFQMIDDCLDLFSSKEALGKNPGQDLLCGELTLPIIELLEKESNRTDLMALLKNRRQKDSFDKILILLHNADIVDACKRRIQVYFDKAEQILKQMSLSQNNTFLYDFLEIIVANWKTYF